MSNKRFIYRDSGTGLIVTKEFAEANPSTTTKETVNWQEPEADEPPAAEPADPDQPNRVQP